MTDYQHIRYAVADGILTITLHRPEALNALTALMVNELLDAFDRSDKDDSIKCVIVTGEGRAFCAGADLGRGAATWSEHDTKMKEQEAGSPYKGDGGGRVTRRIFDSHKPVIAAINGPAVGVGLTMTLAMDIRMAAANTNPILVPAVAMRTSMAKVMVRPTPTAGPLMAAITGLCESKIRRVTRPPPSPL